MFGATRNFFGRMGAETWILEWHLYTNAVAVKWVSFCVAQSISWNVMNAGAQQKPRCLLRAFTGSTAMLCRNAQYCSTLISFTFRHDLFHLKIDNNNAHLCLCPSHPWFRCISPPPPAAYGAASSCIRRREVSANKASAVSIRREL